MGLKILAFTDFHGNQDAYRRATERIGNEQPDFVIVAGDIINHDANRAKQLLSGLANAGRPVCFVPGNMDGEELGKWTGGANILALHARGENLKGCFIMGLGGSPHGPFRTVFEYSEEEAAVLLETAARDFQRGQLILVSHCPPKDTDIDKVTLAQQSLDHGEAERAGAAGHHDVTFQEIHGLAAWERGSRGIIPSFR